MAQAPGTVVAGAGIQCCTTRLMPHGGGSFVLPTSFTNRITATTDLFSDPLQESHTFRRGSNEWRASHRGEAGTFFIPVVADNTKPLDSPNNSGVTPGFCQYTTQFTPLSHSTTPREVRELLQKEAIEPTMDQSGFYSPMFVVPKKDGGEGVVPYNQPQMADPVSSTFQNGEHFLIERPLKSGNFMGKLDLKDTYLMVPIAKEHRQYLRFTWQNKALQFKSPPFGLATAPRTFTKLLKPVSVKLRQEGLRVIWTISS